VFVWDLFPDKKAPPHRRGFSLPAFLTPEMSLKRSVLSSPSFDHASSAFCEFNLKMKMGIQVAAYLPHFQRD
jgi:hypothetical protein